ncbi:hypothetical protein CRM22_003450 [Opisthorchis felineus]|uniref:SOWAHA-C winged helix-turn-helix domain-containing protein n=1 Tax=Opisthorchis felineus TaxID=147828 RepID=A0A4S2M145_OPIFE|nr:hypothetical protein CRM22_003450 [Opisthorchis felineus]
MRPFRWRAHFEMDLKTRIADAIRRNGGRLPCNQLISLFSENYLKDPESKRLFKKAVSAVAVVEHGEDKRRFVVLKELARNKENVTTDQTVVSQSTQTPTSRLPVELHAQKHVCGTANKTVAKQQQVQTYSMYTGSEPRQWWIASAECRHADMSRLLGLNPKLVNWNDEIYASSYVIHLSSLGFPTPDQQYFP